MSVGFNEHMVCIYIYMRHFVCADKFEVLCWLLATGTGAARAVNSNGTPVEFVPGNDYLIQPIHFGCCADIIPQHKETIIPAVIQRHYNK